MSVFFRKSALLAIGLLFHCSGAMADEFRLLPFINMRQEYNDNIFMSNEDSVSDFVTTLSPGLKLAERTERLDARLSARVDRIRYTDRNELNALDEHYQGRIGYQLSERAGVSSKVRHTKDSRRDRDIEETGLLLGTVTRRKRICNLSGTYLLSETTGMSLSYDYNRDEFNDPDFSDYRSRSLNLGITHRLVPLLSARMNLGYARYDFVDSITENYSWTPGISWAMSEIFSLAADFGARYTCSEFETTKYEPVFFSDIYPDLPVDPENDFITGYRPAPYIDTLESWGLSWQVLLEYKGEKTHAGITLSRDVKGASGSGGTTERTVASLNISRRFTYEIRASLSATYHLNQTDQEGLATEEQHTLRIQPKIRFDCTREIALEMAYIFTSITDNKTDAETNRNLVFARLSFQYPLLE